jgi:predicted acylesterase/phospholipase RssA
MTGIAEYESRDWHLAPRAGEGKRILALDGGGSRGLITLGILKRIEETLAARSPGRPEDFRLCHYFDLIAGTSTGAIIATALAMGKSVDQVHAHYREMCPVVFGRTSDSLLAAFSNAIYSVYDAAPLEQLLKAHVGNHQLQSPALKTGLMICAKRIDTGSPWVLTNNPRARFWESPSGKWKPNKEYELWRLLRASAAAPFYFEPVKVDISEPGGLYDPEVGVFVDGAVGGFNNPALKAFLVATLAPYGFAWASGADHLLLVSVGTGWWRIRHKADDFLEMRNWQKAREALAAMVQDTSLHVTTTLQALSEPRKPWLINSEVDALDGHLAHGVEALRFQRYDAILENDRVARVFPDLMTDRDQLARIIARLRDIGSNDADVLRRLYVMGHDVGNVTRPGTDGIEPADFPAMFDPPGFRSVDG